MKEEESFRDNENNADIPPINALPAEQRGRCPEPSRCPVCGRGAALGETLWALREGVWGPRGFAALEPEPRLFCSIECLRRWRDLPARADPWFRRLP